MGSGSELQAAVYMGNDSQEGHPSNVTLLIVPAFNQVSLIKTSVLSAFFVVSLVGNSATLVQMYRMRRRRSTINTLILHLAVADLIVTFFCFVTDAVWASTIQWYAGNILCKLIKFLQVFGLYLSSYVVVIISIDRCYAILDPMSKNSAPRRVRNLIIIAWSLSAFFSSPQAYIFRVRRGPYREDFYQCVTFGAYSAVWQERLYSCISVLLNFALPLIAMIVAYMLIFCTIAKKSRDLHRQTDSSKDMLSRVPIRGQLFRRAKEKSLRMTTLIVAAFIICWTPYYVIFLTSTFTELTEELMRKSQWIFAFGMANSMVNPLIYGAFHMCGRKRRPRPSAIEVRSIPRTQSSKLTMTKTHVIPPPKLTRSLPGQPTNDVTASLVEKHFIDKKDDKKLYKCSANGNIV